MKVSVGDSKDKVPSEKFVLVATLDDNIEA